MPCFQSAFINKQWWIHHPKLAKTSECNDGLIKVGRQINGSKMNAVHKISASKVLWNKISKQNSYINPTLLIKMINWNYDLVSSIIITDFAFNYIYQIVFELINSGASMQQTQYGGISPCFIRNAHIKVFTDLV